MPRKGGQISILQVDEQLISLLRVRHGGKGVHVSAFEQERGQWSFEEGTLRDALKEFAAKHGIQGDDIYSILPRHDMTARILTLPSQDESELEGMVALGAEEFVPFPLDDLVVDYSTLEHVGDGQSRVLAVFAHKDVVNRHVNLLHESGVEPKRIFVSTACLASAAIAAAGDAEEPARSALVHCASGGLEVLVLEGERLLYDRGVAADVDWTRLSEEGGEANEELIVETRASLAAFRRESEDGIGAEQVQLCGEYADVSTAAEPLSTELGYECSPARYLIQLATKGNIDGGRIPAASLGGALAALGHARVDINLVPESLLQARKRSAQRQQLIAAGLIVAGIIVALLGWLGVASWQRQAYLEELDEQIARVQPQAEEVRGKLHNLRVLQGQVGGESTALEVLAAISQAAPNEELNIIKIVYNRGEGVEIVGHVQDLPTATRFSEKLRTVAQERGIPVLLDARVGESRRAQERESWVTEYEIISAVPEEEESPAS